MVILATAKVNAFMVSLFGMEPQPLISFFVSA